MNDRQPLRTQEPQPGDSHPTDAGVTYGREDRSWFDAAPETFEGDVVIGAGEQALGARVLSALRRDPMLDARHVQVSAQGEGAIVLSGKVKDASDRALAGLIARRQLGVLRLANRLEIEQAIHEDSIWPHGVDHVPTTSERFTGLRKD